MAAVSSCGSTTPTASVSREEFVEAIRDDLAWMGLNPDAEVRQSERFDLYEREFERLKTAGRVYACYETPEELDLRRKVLLGRGLPPVYERKPADAPAPEGRPPHWRFRLDHDAPIEWNDLIRGPQRFDPKLLSDPVVRREDGSWLYLLPSVIDDVDLGSRTSFAARIMSPTARRRSRCSRRLAPKPPAFAHEALLVAAEGKLSKRLGSYGAEHLREEGVEPMAHAVAARPHRHVAAGRADRQPRRAGARISTLPISAARPRISIRTMSSCSTRACCTSSTSRRSRTGFRAGATEEDWLLLRPNLERLSDFGSWFEVLHGEVEAPELAPRRAPARARRGGDRGRSDWKAEPWRALTSELKTVTGRKGRELFHPLRLALTGRDSGPEMAGLSSGWARTARSSGSEGRRQALSAVARQPFPGRRRCR